MPPRTKTTPEKSKPSPGLPATIGGFLDYLLPGWQAQMPPRPPDVFALAAALLQRSGAYSFVSDRWPPSVGWADKMREVGYQWRRAWAGEQSLPEELSQWWNTVATHHGLEMAQIRDNSSVCRALLQLSAAADEASVGIGLAPDKRRERPPSENTAEYQRVTEIIQKEVYGGLQLGAKTGSTLCQSIHSSKLRVLPKLHTPQNGLTIRSLSRSLALCGYEEIRADWVRAFGFLNRLPAENRQDNSLNLLIVPCPEVVRPSQFQPVGEASRGFGYFTYQPDLDSGAVPPIADIMRRAQRMSGPIHGVVLPELSLTSTQFEKIAGPVLQQGAFLVGGVVKAPSVAGQPGNNVLQYRQSLSLASDHTIRLEQNKHHRWKLDKSQIVQYGLGSTLDPEKLWWEHIPLEERRLLFVSIYHWLTMSVLICEDLARPDPVGDLVRAVGPNLVVALLMDGPQLSNRWPGRYATVLADDPGCSVLSLSSLGMVELSRPPRVPAGSRVVALWKDAKSGGPVEIELPRNADALVLNLTVQYMEEFTADGRSDQCTTGYPILSGVHPVLLAK